MGVSTPTALSPEIPGRLADALRSGRFAVTAEVAPPRGADLGPVRRAADHLRGWVDAVNVTDNAGANVRVSSLAGSLALLEAGVEPVMQMTCRDRNRIALQSDLLAASALGVPNLVLMTGDRPEQGDHPDAAAVFDLDSGGLMAAARSLRDEGVLLSGRSVDPAPRWLLGAVDSPGPSADRFAQKVDGGAQFVQTQFVFDVDAFSGWLSQVRDRGLDARCGVLAGVGPIRSLRALEFLSSIPGVSVPEQLERRLRGVPSDKVAAEGVAACVDTVRELRELPGVAGVHVMVVGDERGVPEILEAAGMARTS
ncbi:methylenetetrahydrofolate reductase [Pseudonocardia dioxanivorans CB1190]|uniref:Methylenetetrahydrofolate reductase n=1 Tax=Pseudonocardia dioxanivorans (strain ATCC 55486 / DSM 44775 / JCM 13855 / CB1190) TaxID=675635 RepID=F4CV10_PSEUX|nr:methylenetetrahydrofolate reductase [Pseudonocardia dioxanivorans CB1190]GJF06908.1 methylenetetrahydrofolate reductase [Pseudonocardia sp. D17]